MESQKLLKAVHALLLLHQRMRLDGPDSSIARVVLAVERELQKVDKAGQSLDNKIEHIKTWEMYPKEKREVKIRDMGETL